MANKVEFVRDEPRGIPTKVFRVTWGRYRGNVEFMRDGVQNVPTVFYRRHSQLGAHLTRNDDGIRSFVANELRGQLDDMAGKRVIFVGT